MLHGHVFSDISGKFHSISCIFLNFTGFHRISQIYLNFAGLRPHEISDALSYGHPTYHVNVIKLKWAIIRTGEVTLPKRITWTTRGPPPPCKQALSAPVYRTLNTQKSLLSGPPTRKFRKSHNFFPALGRESQDSCLLGVGKPFTVYAHPRLKRRLRWQDW